MAGGVGALVVLGWEGIRHGGSEDSLMAEYGYVPRFSWRDWFKVTTSYPYWDQWFELVS